MINLSSSIVKDMLAGSELESMCLDPQHHGGLKFVFHGLSAEVLVEETGSPSECVLLVLEVVLFHVIYETRAHVCMVVSWAQGRG